MNGDIFPDFDSFIEKMARRVFDKELKKGNIDLETWKITTGLFAKQVQDGFGKRLADMSFGTPEHSLLSNLLENAGVFAAFKNHQNVSQLVGLLVDKNGRIRPYEEFRDLALELNKDYNRNWLQAEYQTARLTARQAKNWQRYQEDLDLFPNFTYQTAGDERVRLNHRPLDGITLPFNDPFWDTWFPPNGWRCRCDGKQSAGSLVLPPEDLPKPKDGFAFNPGKAQKIVDDSHPYMKNAGARTKNQVASFLGANAVKHYTPSQSIAEAERFAVNGGLAEEVSYKGLELEVADEINKALMQLKLDTGQNYNAIKTLSEKVEGAWMATTLRKSTGKHRLGIYLPTFDKYKGLESLNDGLASIERTGFSKVKDLKGLISHEFGHLLTTRNLEGLDEEFLKSTVYNISEYANFSLSESLAEIFTAYRYGIKLDEEALTLFNIYSIFNIRQ